MKPQTSIPSISKSNNYETPLTTSKKPNSGLDNIVAQVIRDEKQISIPVKKSHKRWLSLLCSCFRSVDPDNTKDILDNVNPILPPQPVDKFGRKTLILDLDETLVHSAFERPSYYDFTIPVEIDGKVSSVYVLKRPGVEEFMNRMNELYEVVIFTASLGKYADPLLEKLDPYSVVSNRLFRESCTLIEGMYVKDLCKLGRKLKDVIIVDNSPFSYYLNPENAVPIISWFDDLEDRELMQLVPVLEHLASVDDVMPYLNQINKTVLYDANGLCDLLGVKRAQITKSRVATHDSRHPLLRLAIRSEANSPIHRVNKARPGFYVVDEESAQ